MTFLKSRYGVGADLAAESVGYLGGPLKADRE